MNIKKIFVNNINLLQITYMFILVDVTAIKNLFHYKKL